MASRRVVILDGTRVSFVVTLLVCVVKGVTRPTAIKMENNAYKGIMVAIHPSVKEDTRLVDNIKSMFREGSSYLYTATERRAYFSDVTLLIPSTWSANPAWAPATSQLYKNADVIVQDPTPIHRRATKRSANSPTNQTDPDISEDSTLPPGSYTRSYGGCGQQGVRIHMFTEIFGPRGKYKFGPAGRILVHEWARFRWGVFEEFSQEGEPQFYFSPTTGALEPVKCNINIRGRIYRKNPVTDVASICTSLDPLTGMYHEDCIFSPYTNGRYNDNVTASIMDRPKVPQIVHFCNDDRSDPKRVHNYEAPNRHNRLCGSRSTWAVITDSTDFSNGANPPRTVANTEPSFTVVRLSSNRRMLLAIDTSDSMEDDDKLVRARQAATTFIEDGLDDDSTIGVVSFSTVAKLLSPLVNVSNHGSRRNVSRSLPRETGGKTSIGAALLRSLEELERHDQNASNAFIVLVTDGKETEAPKIMDVIDKVKDAGAVVSVITFSDDAHHTLEHLAEITGGRYYYDNNYETSTVATDAMLDVYSLYHAGDQHQGPVQVISQAGLVPHNVELSGRFQLDSSLGRDTRLVVTYTDQLPDIVVTSPSGRTYSSIYPEYEHDPDLMRVKITIPKLAEVGRWSYSIKNKNSILEKVSIMALSSARVVNTPRLCFTGAILVENNTWPIRSRIIAEVTKGDVPVKNLKVKATVDRPMAASVELELFDSGAGADAVKDDGIYSRFFTQFSVSGRYTVTIQMLNEDGDVLVTGSMDSSALYYIARVYAGSVHIEHPKLTPGTSSKENVLENVDEFPPMRITDLRVLMTSRDNGTVVLAWTAPGDDRDYDRASHYIIIQMEKAEDFIRDQPLYTLPDDAVTDGDLHAPKEFGQKEQVTLRLTVASDRNVSMVFSVFAKDEVGNQGELSNLVTVGFGYVPDVITEEFLSEEKPVVSVDDQAPPDEQQVLIASFLGSFAGLLAIVVIGTIIVHFVMSRKKIVSEKSLIV